MYQQLLEKISLSFAELYYDAPIVYIVFEKDTVIGFPQVRELTKAAEQLSKFKPYLVLSEVKSDVSITPEGRKLSNNGKESPLLRASAVVVRTELLSMAANVFSALKPPSYPYKAFSSREKALEWLKQYSVEN